MSKTDIDKAWSFFTHHVNHCIDNFIPLKNVKKKFNKPKWMDHYCVRKVKKKYHAWKRYTFTRNYRDYEEYCRARNSATKAIRFSKVKHQKGVAESCRDSPKAFWSYVKSETKTKSSVNDLIDSNGNTCSTGEDKARVLNDFFSSVFTKEDEGDLPDFTNKVHYNDFVQSVKIDEQKVFKVLNQLKTSKACGPDNCHPFFLKTCVNELYKPLCHIFKLSVDSGKIPKDWKNANVTCLFKKGDKANPSNYRPVSLTSVICKLLEKKIKETLLEHLEKHDLLNDCQFGFRKHRNTILQLLTVLEDWTRYLDDDCQVDTVYFDFQKAFDSVPHRRLLKKVEGYGIKGELLKWLSDFLKHRRQRVVVNGCSSEWTEVFFGNPSRVDSWSHSIYHLC